jgi:hypothetical protein
MAAQNSSSVIRDYITFHSIPFPRDVIVLESTKKNSATTYSFRWDHRVINFLKLEQD